MKSKDLLERYHILTHFISHFFYAIYIDIFQNTALDFLYHS